MVTHYTLSVTVSGLQKQDSAGAAETEWPAEPEYLLPGTSQETPASPHQQHGSGAGLPGSKSGSTIPQDTRSGDIFRVCPSISAPKSRDKSCSKIKSLDIGEIL